MNTLEAFVRNMTAIPGDRKVFDWDKAAQIIKERKPKYAVAGLQDDMEYTSGVIWNEGKPFKDSDTYLASNWAVPVLVLDDEDEIPCYLMASDTKYDQYTKWPKSALDIIEGD